MAGVEKITEEILQEARARADEILKAAEAAAGAVRASADRESRKARLLSDEKAQRDAENYRARIRSSIDIRKKKAVLSAKQEMIKDTVDKAYAKLDQMEEGPYFAFLLKVLEQSVQAGDGTVIFSERDLARLPEGLEKKISEIAAAKGGSLKLSDTPGRIDNGFVLSYGGIEENCCLRAIFDSEKDKIQDQATHILFS